MSAEAASAHPDLPTVLPDESGSFAFEPKKGSRPARLVPVETAPSGAQVQPDAAPAAEPAGEPAAEPAGEAGAA